MTEHASESWYNAPNGYQYYLSLNAFKTDSYARSRRYCQYQGGDLAHVGMRDEAIYRFVWVVSTFSQPCSMQYAV